MNEEGMIPRTITIALGTCSPIKVEALLLAIRKGCAAADTNVHITIHHDDPTLNASLDSLLSTVSVGAEANHEQHHSLLVDLFPIDVPSKVPSQPIGPHQTESGARNRALGSLAALKCRSIDSRHVVIAFGVENGMWPSAASVTETPAPLADNSNDGGWVDGACVVLCSQPTARDEVSTMVAWSDVIAIPPLCERSFARGKNGCWAELKDPHAVLTGGAKMRRDFLVDPLLHLWMRVLGTLYKGDAASLASGL